MIRLIANKALRVADGYRVKDVAADEPFEVQERCVEGLVAEGFARRDEPAEAAPETGLPEAASAPPARVGRKRRA